MKILAAIKKFLISVIFYISQNYYDDSNKLIIGKIKDEAGGFAIENLLD